MDMQSTGLGGWLPPSQVDPLDLQPPPGLADDMLWTTACRAASRTLVVAAKNAVEETDMPVAWKTLFDSAMSLLRHAQTSIEAAEAYLIARHAVMASDTGVAGLVQARDAAVWLILAAAGVESRQRFFMVVRNAFGPHWNHDLHSQCMMSAKRLLASHGLDHTLWKGRRPHSRRGPGRSRPQTSDDDHGHSVTSP